MFDLDALDDADMALAALTHVSDLPRAPRRVRTAPDPAPRQTPAACPYARERAA